MGFFSEERLKKASSSSFMDQETRSFLKESTFFASKTIFLSHSHKDKELVIGLQRYLAKEGHMLYIDWQDFDMPRITNKETALKIKSRIKELDFFFILASENAMKSRWVPWEIGVADILKVYEKILLIPVSDSNCKFRLK